VSSAITSDPHSEPGNQCPKNFFDIANYSELLSIEAPLVAKRAGELDDLGVTGKFDSVHLCAIHHDLFQDVFPWAGELRLVNISKDNSRFAPALHIATALADVMEKLRCESLLANLSLQKFAERAAYYLGEINAIHPFREGNGRAQREFIRQLGVHAGHPLSWAGFTERQMTDASILSHAQGDNTQLAAIIEVALFSTRERG
jgi:cell filamentation protein